MDWSNFRRSANVEDRTKPKSEKKVAGFDVIMPDFVPTSPRFKPDPKLAKSTLAKQIGIDDLPKLSADAEAAPVPDAPMMMAAKDGNGIRDAIIRAAREEGVDPATALAWASRESSFDPSAKASKSMRGLYQMSGTLRRQYGIGDTADPYEQTKGFARYYRGLKDEMKRTLGRDPTDTEAYLGHHFGGARGARTLGMDPNTPVSAVFTPYERSLNPHFDRAGSIGNLTGSITRDIDRRYAKFGGQGGGAAEPMDFTAAVEGNSTASPESLDFSQQVASLAGPAPQQQAAAQPEPLDFTQQVQG